LCFRSIIGGCHQNGGRGGHVEMPFFVNKHGECLEQGPKVAQFIPKIFISEL